MPPDYAVDPNANELLASPFTASAEDEALLFELNTYAETIGLAQDSPFDEADFATYDEYGNQAEPVGQGNVSPAELHQFDPNLNNVTNFEEFDPNFVGDFYDPNSVILDEFGSPIILQSPFY